ncbi:hypothetical protein O7626_17175 [Micromonospora sp. WMMD1102]|uniref:hypothetical protein n=1 Tax=Micromonospora sp. WMMD1102 TaxID=3016105 RepID=UPI0024152F4D|nr:hypothetical protein [Micromonospora sp. WMMD1102]MDG4787648.1 hypothetical protein [Micromonospora sp. WMMD1102]
MATDPAAVSTRRSELADSARLAADCARRAVLLLDPAQPCTVRLRDAAAYLNGAYCLLTDTPEDVEPSQPRQFAAPMAGAIHHTRSAAILASWLITVPADPSHRTDLRYNHALPLTALAVGCLDSALLALTRAMRTSSDGRVAVAPAADNATTPLLEPVPQQRRQRLRATVAVVTAAIIVASLATVAPGRRIDQQPVRGVGRTQDPAVSPGPTSTPSGSGVQLLQMADRISAAPGDAQRGPYAYVELRQWSRDIRRAPDRSGKFPPLVVTVQSWGRSDGAGREMTFQVGDGGCRRGEEARWEAGMPGATDEDLPTDPVTLRTHLLKAKTPAERGPRDIVTSVADLHRTHYADRPVRAAILRILAELPGITLQHGVRDRMGRIGVSIALVEPDAQGTRIRYVLTIAPDTAELLAYEVVQTGPPVLAQPDYLAGLELYRLYLTSGRSTTTTAAVPSCI